MAITLGSKKTGRIKNDRLVQEIDELILSYEIIGFTENRWRAGYPIDISLFRQVKWIYMWYIPRLMMEQASVFKSNKSQAVRLPKPVALPESVKKVDKQIRHQNRP